MDNIKICDVCGLCGGCLYAIKTAKETKKQYKNVSIFKEIVHNNNVNQNLMQDGIKLINSLDNVSDEVVIIRAHGEPPSTYDFLNQNNIKYVDCTCKNVEKIHNLVSEYSQNNYKIIIIGKYGKFSNVCHPEILGTIGYSKNKPILIEDEEDVNKLKLATNDKFYLVCQTTFNIEKAQNIINSIKNILKNKELIINNSICNAQRQINEHSKSLAKNSDLMIVVGGKNSSNSKELYENVRQFCQSIFIEDINEIKNELTKNKIIISSQTKIGLTAGASTMKEELTSLKEILNHIIKENESEN